MEVRKKIFINKLHLFGPTIRSLNEAEIDWMLAGSGCLYLLGNDRIPDDADIFLKDNIHDAADELFKIKSFIYKSDVESVRNSNPEGSHDMQLTSHLKINVGGKEYGLSITDEMMKKRIKTEIDGEPVWLLAPEDVLIVKALLQRGSEVGKSDLEDIQNFMKIYPNIDKDYIRSRITSLGANQRIGEIFF